VTVAAARIDGPASTTTAATRPIIARSTIVPAARASSTIDGRRDAIDLAAMKPATANHTISDWAATAISIATAPVTPVRL
jgi:hypothetical protein